MPSDQNVLRPKRPYVFERNFSLKLKYHLIQGRVVDLKVPIKTGWHVRHTLPRVDISVYLIRYLIKCDSQLRRLIVNYLLLLKLFIAKSEKCFLTPRRHSNRTHKSAIYWTPMRHSNHWATRTQMATRFVRATYVLLNQWISCYRSNPPPLPSLYSIVRWTASIKPHCRQVTLCDPIVFFARLSLSHASLARVVCLNDIIRF